MIFESTEVHIGTIVLLGTL